MTGSDSGRLSMRTGIQAACMHFGQPSIWATINPDNIHDPIMQIFAGEDIDLDKFNKLSGPNNQTRGTNIAQDPYAAAKFFNFIVKAVLETLMGHNHTSSSRDQERCIRASSSLLWYS